MSLAGDICAALADLELVSHAPIQGYNFAPNNVGRGERWRVRDTRAPIAHLGQHQAKGGDTKIPTGTDRERPADLQEAMDLRASYHGKTVGYFAAKRQREGDSPELLAEIRETVSAWRVLKIPEGQPPALGDPQWKRFIYESKKDSGALASEFGVTRRYINKVRQAEGVLVREALEAETRRRPTGAGFRPPGN